MKKIFAFIFILAVIFTVAGCRTKGKQTIQYYESGKISSQSYETETGFYFFSDGAGKVVSPSLTVSGVNF